MQKTRPTKASPSLNAVHIIPPPETPSADLLHDKFRQVRQWIAAGRYSLSPDAIIKNFASKFGVPQIFDEATVSSGLNMKSLLYTITLEQDKSRCNSSADLRIPDTWKLIAITSSENRLLTDSRMHNRGLDARILSFELGFTDSRDHSDKIHDFCGKQYGILGKVLSEHLLTVDHPLTV